MLQIKSFTGDVLIERDLDSWFGVYLRNANLGIADLGNADLRNADLRNANLGIADLGNADLSYSNLSYANLSYADLRGAQYNPLQVLAQLWWGRVSDELCLELMRFDASMHPNPEAFDYWKKTGRCPFEGVYVTRAVQFNEKREIWSAGPSLSPIELLKRLFHEKGIKSDFGTETA